MKRKLFAWLLCLGMICALAFSVSAEEQPRIIDEAELLTASEEAELEALSRHIRESCGMDVVILTVNSLEGRSPQSYADDYYDYGGYGCGSDCSGMLFLLSMEYRDWCVSTCGRAVSVMDGDAIDDSVERILPKLSEGDYAGAFSQWLRNLPDDLERGDAGSSGTESPHYVTPGIRPRRFNFGLPLLIGFVTAAAVVFGMVCMNKTNRPQSGAVGYLDARSFRIFNQKDLFLSSHVSKTRKADPPSGGSRSGGSIHRSSGGRSHGGRSGKF